jgi:hypothetical protein
MNEVPTPKSSHTRVAQTLQQMVEVVILGDWRTLTKDELIQQAARLRTVKAQYILAHLRQHQEMQPAILQPLDQALLELYILLDHLDGCHSEQQQDVYRALLAVQFPLLAAYAQVPGEDPEEKAVEEGQEAPVEENVTSEHETPAGAPQEKEGRFSWTEERVRTLKEALSQHSTLNAHVASMQIAAHYGWPEKTVEYKVYALRKAASARQAASTAHADDAKEDDRSDVDHQ